MKLAITLSAFALGCLLPWVTPWLVPTWVVLILLLLLGVPGPAWQRGVIILFLAGLGYGLRAEYG